MRATFSFFIMCFIFFIEVSSLSVAQSKNELQIGAGMIRFFDWPVNTQIWQFGYTRLVTEKIVIHSDISYVGHDLHSDGFYFEDLSSGDVFSRDDWFIDVSFGYNLLEFYEGKLVLEGFVGPSFISGFDVAFDYLINNSFGEVSVTGKYRNNPGLNLGLGLKYIPFTRMSIGIKSKLHVFTKPPADFSIGVLLGFRFGDPHCKKKKS